MVTKIVSKTWYHNPETHVLIVEPDTSTNKFEMPRDAYSIEGDQIVEFLETVFCGATMAMIRQRLQTKGY